MQTKIKKKIYLALTITLIFLLGFILYAMIEAAYIKEVVSIGGSTVTVCYFGFLWKELPFWLRLFWIFVAIVDGYFLGQYWWRIVYVEKRHWSFHKNKVTTKKKRVVKSKQKKHKDAKLVK